jgi:uncharacterized protein YrzB (UPF0473 family)
LDFTNRRWFAILKAGKNFFLSNSFLKKAKEAPVPMSEEYGNDFVTLIDEDGNEVEFEHIDTVEYQGTTYLAFIPAELAVEEDAEVVIMQIVMEDGEEMLEAVEDDEIADAVFNIVMERAEAEEDE